MGTGHKSDSFNPAEHLLPHIVDHYSAVKPNAVYAEFPRCPSTYDQGYRTITYGELANAVNALAGWLIRSIGVGSFETLEYIGPNDFRYVALALGAVKAGYTMFFTSPRNSAAAHAKLLDELQCKTMILPRPSPSVADEILKHSGLRVLNVLDVEDLLQADCPPVRYDRTLSQSRMEPLLTIHTSGSTGLPKPMTLTHASAVAGMRMSTMKPPRGRAGLNLLIAGKRVYSMLPPFHGAYLACHLMNAVPFDTVMVTPISSGIPSAAGLAQALNQTNIDVAILAPSIVEQLAESPEVLEYCAERLKCILYAGGHLPDHVGDRVATKIPLYNQFGSTEVGLVPLLISQTPYLSGDWRYLEFHPDLGLEMRPALGEQHELCAIRAPALEQQQLAFTYHGYTDTTEYSTRDLFVRHPRDSRRWKWDARNDDILVLLNGEKTNPISMEQQIMQHPQISGALVVGAHRFQPALLLEVKAELAQSGLNQVMTEVWPIVETANKDCPAHARIAKSHILFTDSSPMRRSGKGTIQRGATTELYEGAIDQLYQGLEDGKACTLSSCEVQGHDSVSSIIMSIIQSVTGWEQLSSTDDFFIRGMDSLQALNAARALQRRFGIEDLPLALIYSHSTVKALARALKHQKSEPGARVHQSNDKDLLSERRGTLDFYRKLIDQIPGLSIYRPSGAGHCVLLTESTGSLHPFLLHELLESPAVHHVYCIKDLRCGRAAQSVSGQQPGLSTNLDPCHVTFLQGNLAHDSLGLERITLDELQHRVTLVVHNAWPINLDRPLTFFAPQLRGLVNLIGFCSSATAHATLFVVSSIGAQTDYQSPSRKIPERVIDLSKPAINGYAESQYIAEHLLDHASKRLGICTSIARLAHVPGPIQLPSRWDLNEWLPTLVVGSCFLGALPDSLGPRLNRIDWIPVDHLSGVLVELCLHGKSEQRHSSVVYHPVNLRPSIWESILPVVLEECHRASFSDIQVVPVTQWLESIRRHEQLRTAAATSHETGNDIGDRLARLADFYETVLGSQVEAAFPETSETARRSAKLSTVPGVQNGWVQKWVREWIRASPSLSRFMEGCTSKA